MGWGALFLAIGAVAQVAGRTPWATAAFAVAILFSVRQPARLAWRSVSARRTGRWSNRRSACLRFSSRSCLR